MSDLRIKAVELAICVSKTADELVEGAAKVLAFLEDSSKSASKPATSAKAKAAKASSASTPAASEPPAATSSTSTASESTASEAASTPASGTSQESKLPSVDDVRAALTARQTRDGGDATAARAVLAKYAKTGTLGSLAEGDRAKVIAECNAAS